MNEFLAVQLSLYLVALITMICVHEFGHYVYWKLFINSNVRMGWFQVVGYHYGIPKKKVRWYHMSGILVGLLPVLAFPLVFPIFLVTLGTYIVGCTSDIRALSRLLKE